MKYKEFTVSPESHLPIERTSPLARESDIVSRLEWLDDLMFAAIDGDPASLQAAADAWKTAHEELGGDELEESRRQYLRRAQSVWHDLRSKPNHPPHKVFAAIEIISLLADKVW